jgi:hypothetical protein
MMCSGDDIRIRTATDVDAHWVVTMIYRMVQEMARHGGYEPASAEIACENLQRPIGEQLASKDACYLLAESAPDERLGVAGAEVRTLGGV